MGGTQYQSGILTKMEKESIRISKNNSQILRLLKVNTDQIDHSSTDNSLTYATPKDRSQMLTRMKTSDEKNSNTFIYGQKRTAAPFASSHSVIKENISMKSSAAAAVYSNTQISSSNNNLMINSQFPKSSASNKKTSKVERDFSLKPSDNKKITLPQINNNHLSQDYSKVSIQLNNGNDNSKYRNNKISQEKYTLKKFRGQSLNNEIKQSSSNIIKQNKKLD